MLGLVKHHKISEQTLLQRLTDYVDRIDTDLVRHLVPEFTICLRAFVSVAYSIIITKWHQSV